MTLRRLLIGTVMVAGLTTWAWTRPGTANTHAREADPIYTVEQTDAGGGTHDEALARFKSGQARHWRQVVIGKK